MKVKAVDVRFSFTKNLGNYESTRMEAGMVVELTEQEDHKVVFKTAFDTVKKEVQEQMMKTLGTKHGSRLKEVKNC